jgi:hypothetical protein
MRAMLSLLVAVFVAVAVVLCALALEPLRWCVVHARPWRRPRTLLRRS